MAGKPARKAVMNVKMMNRRTRRFTDLTLLFLSVSVKVLKLFEELFLVAGEFFGDFYIKTEILVAAILGAEIWDTAAAKAK